MCVVGLGDRRHMEHDSCDSGGHAVIIIIVIILLLLLRSDILSMVSLDRSVAVRRRRHRQFCNHEISVI